MIRVLVALSVSLLVGCGGSGVAAAFDTPAAQAKKPSPEPSTGALAVEVDIEPPAPGPDRRDHATVAARSTRLSLVTYNTWGLPAPVGTDLGKRFQAMPGVLGGFDVVALQETFTGDAKALLSHTFYPYSHRQESSEFLRLNSGLTVLSKHRILETDFKPFEECADWDCAAQKGVLFIRVDVAGFGPVDIYNTHYQAHVPYPKQRLHDNRIMAGLVRDKDAGHPTFLLGDFNMVEGGDEYQDLMHRLSPVDLYRSHRPADKGGTSKSGSRIDYVFNRPTDGYEVRVLDSAVMFEDTGLSDHNGVRVDVQITARP